MKAIRVIEYGTADVLKIENVEIPDPKVDEAKVNIKAVGVNYIDIYHRKGLYPNIVPFTLGMEAAGIVDAIGKNVSEVKKGDRVAYAMNLGSYAEYAIVPAWKLAPIPDYMDYNTAAAIMLQGMTAHYLTQSTFKIEKYNTILLHAAAGGVGLLLTQIAKNLGARVIGTVSNEEKAKLAKQAGVDDIIIYTKDDFEEKVKEFTDDIGVDVVYDSVGKITFEKSIKCLKNRGYLVLFGQSSGPVLPFELNTLSDGALFITRPSLKYYVTNRQELLQRTNDLFQWIKEDKLKLKIFKTFPLSEAKEAHKALESRETSGKLLLIP